MWAIPISVAQNQTGFLYRGMFTTVNPEHYLPSADAWGFAVMADTAFPSTDDLCPKLK